ncbi:DUF413 domain-containing protein [Oceanobacter mangrovi]|uniref:DUF413 domain-containing protein n=1 Tax=Oceanobacter mangrovi TaxID=2862510 RepID=UPI001C8DF19E|nr:DUF413 domain-containing protein [Oceanobacter mangrovi]
MSFDSPKKFFDDINFPRGFHRSGDFTRAQADILESKGAVLKALHDGSQPPADDVEERFLQVCHGDAQPQSDVEKAWTRYLSALRRKQVYFTASSAAVTDGATETADSDD